jgi:hypothetical protein
MRQLANPLTRIEIFSPEKALLNRRLVAFRIGEMDAPRQGVSEYAGRLNLLTEHFSSYKSPFMASDQLADEELGAGCH